MSYSNRKDAAAEAAKGAKKTAGHTQAAAAGKFDDAKKAAAHLKKNAGEGLETL